MQRLIGWLSDKRTSRATPDLRRRIDLGAARPGYPIYAIGDVHGCLDELKRAEERIAADIELNALAGPVILLGDYVDRGPASAQVIEHLIQPSEFGLRRLALCGNHEQMFLNFLAAPERHGDWLTMGGDKTLLSYGIDIHAPTFRARAKTRDLRRLLDDHIPPAHRDFLGDLPVSLHVGGVLFVHAGVRPGVALEQQRQEDFLWIREPFLSEGPCLASLLVVHGHTPHDEPDPGPQRIGIDTGAFYSGKLTVLRIGGPKTCFI